MNVILKLTMAGLIEALRWTALQRQKDDGRPLKADNQDKREPTRKETDGQ